MPEYPHQSPDYEVPNQPENGDASIPALEDREVVLRPSAERMPFGPSGELLAQGPRLPVDFILAPDIRDFPWTRQRGQEWTTASVRAEVLAWIAAFFSTHAWACRWSVTERTTSPDRAGTRYPHPILLVRVEDFEGISYEVAQAFPWGEHSGAPLALLLAQVEGVLDTLRP